MSVDQYAVVGNPIAHSKSPEIHTCFALQTNQAIEYKKLLLPKDGFAENARSFFDAGGKGLNVTVPFKEDAYKFADQLSQRARLAGAVNTLIINADGTIAGDTTDGVGLVKDILRLNWEIQGKRILILGAGGAVRGVIHALLEIQPKKLIIANRTASKAVALAEQFKAYGSVCGCAFEQLKDKPFDLIINGTSASLSGQLPSIPASLFSIESCVYDMVYGTKPTAFLRWVDELGVNKTSDGLGMLVEQAAESFRLWRGVTPSTEELIAQLRLSMR